ncbi:MAG: 4Fe-4S dicluster domain-containing protein [Methanosarcinales archaeon]|nr:4Fe-4S dicluster domain-containing protein [Methanosarcinales archaeon]
MAKHWFPVFSSEKCRRCQICVTACPLEIIEFDEAFGGSSGKSFGDFPIGSVLPVPRLSDPMLCPVNCFKCAQACPNDAVGIIRPAKPCDCCSF